MSDVLGWSAGDVADSLDCSVASVNRALQRARHTLRSRFEGARPDATIASVTDIREKRVLARFMDAWVRADFVALASLQEDAFWRCRPLHCGFVAAPRSSIFFHRSTRRTPPGHPPGSCPLKPPARSGRLHRRSRRRWPSVLRSDGVHDRRRCDLGYHGFADPVLSDYFALPSWLPADVETEGQS